MKTIIAVTKEQLSALMRSKINFSVYLKKVPEVEFENDSEFMQALTIMKDCKENQLGILEV